jgi:hypothetical protein
MSTNIAKDSHTGVVIRESDDSDLERLRRLAQLDSARLPEQPLVVAEVEGELRAAVSVNDGSVIADPFHRTADLVALAEMRATQQRARLRGRLRVVARTPDSSSPALRERAA